jgi:hypothetical protein
VQRQPAAAVLRGDGGALSFIDNRVRECCTSRQALPSARFHRRRACAAQAQARVTPCEARSRCRDRAHHAHGRTPASQLGSAPAFSAASALAAMERSILATTRLLDPVTMLL